ncbi:hypothetical protein BU17DRAFT_90670 [Hysterangium stoloniferum]|nr:hypothetical protein BU17DRAFT_90670 [Hysterangium stoloniferum]
MALKLIASLGRAFKSCPGVQWWDSDTSTAIKSVLYGSLIKSPLPANLDEVSFTFIVEIARYLSDPDNQHPLLIGVLLDIIENVWHVRQLSLKELIAIRAYCKTCLNRRGHFDHRLHRLFMQCVSQDETLAQSTKIAVSFFRNWTSPLLWTQAERGSEEGPLQRKKSCVDGKVDYVRADGGFLISRQDA